MLCFSRPKIDRLDRLSVCFDFLDQILVCFDFLDQLLVCFDFLGHKSISTEVFRKYICSTPDRYVSIFSTVK